MNNHRVRKQVKLFNIPRPLKRKIIRQNKKRHRILDHDAPMDGFCYYVYRNSNNIEKWAEVEDVLGVSRTVIVRENGRSSLQLLVWLKPKLKESTPRETVDTSWLEDFNARSLMAEFFIPERRHRTEQITIDHCEAEDDDDPRQPIPNDSGTQWKCVGISPEEVAHPWYRNGKRIRDPKIIFEYTPWIVPIENCCPRLLAKIFEKFDMNEDTFQNIIPSEAYFKSEIAEKYPNYFILQNVKQEMQFIFLNDFDSREFQSVAFYANRFTDFSEKQNEEFVRRQCVCQRIIQKATDDTLFLFIDYRVPGVGAYYYIRNASKSLHSELAMAYEEKPLKEIDRLTVKKLRMTQEMQRIMSSGEYFPTRPLVFPEFEPSSPSTQDMEQDWCSFCEVQMSSNVTLAQHKLDKHSLVCKVCKVRYLAENRDAHMRSHKVDRKTHKCQKCPRSYDQRRSLVRHVKEKHSVK